MCIAGTSIKESNDEASKRYEAAAADTACTLFESANGVVVQFASSWEFRVHRNELPSLQVDGTAHEAMLATTTLQDVRIATVEAIPIALPSIRNFAISGGGVTQVGRPAIRVLAKVTASDGTIGWGEATPLPAWTYETLESITSTINHYLAPAIAGRPAWDIDGVTEVFDRTISRGYSIGAPLAKAAVDIALHDLLGKLAAVPIGVLWGQRRCEHIELAWIISTESGAAVKESIDEGLDLGYDAFKVKIGLRDEREDVRLVEQVRACIGDRALWVDANQAYTFVEARRQADRLYSLGVEIMEQPLPANDLAGLRSLKDVSPVPIALDESLRHPRDLATFVKFGAVDIAIAKIQRTGGLTLSRRFCAFAEDAGVSLMGSGLTDSALGFAGSLHLFAAFGMRRPADLNGPQFIESPYAVTVGAIENGKARVPTAPGLGISVDEEMVSHLAVSV